MAAVEGLISGMCRRPIHFYSYIEKLYNLGAVQYRVEESGRAGQGGHYFEYWNATRAEVVMYLHELIYAVSPP